MKPEDRYLKFVRWSDEDRLYIGYCPDLFIGGACHAANEQVAYRKLLGLVREEVAQRIQERLPLPRVSARLKLRRGGVAA